MCDLHSCDSVHCMQILPSPKISNQPQSGRSLLGGFSLHPCLFPLLRLVPRLPFPSREVLVIPVEKLTIPAVTTEGNLPLGAPPRVCPGVAYRGAPLDGSSGRREISHARHLRLVHRIVVGVRVGRASFEEETTLLVLVRALQCSASRHSCSASSNLAVAWRAASASASSRWPASRSPIRHTSSSLSSEGFAAEEESESGSESGTEGWWCVHLSCGLECGHRQSSTAYDPQVAATSQGRAP